MDTIELAADVRETKGKKVRFLRREGLVPANLYGPKVDSIPLQIQKKHLKQALAQGGRNAVLAVNVNGEKSARTAIIRGLQLDPRTDDLLHVDFLQVDVTETITAEIPIHLVGESPLPKGQTLIAQSISSVEVKGLPTELPRTIEVDVSYLTEIDQEVRVGDLQVSADIEVLTDPDQLVVKATRGRVEVEEEVVAEEEEGAEAEEAEGEAEATATEAKESEAESE